MLAPPPIRVRVFLSWCHRDVALKTDLVERLEPNLAILGGIDFSWWEDSQLEIGEAWRRGILDRLSECDYALLLLSPGFFASRFVTTEELPRIIGGQSERACATRDAPHGAARRVPNHAWRRERPSLHRCGQILCRPGRSTPR